MIFIFGFFKRDKNYVRFSYFTSLKLKRVLIYVSEAFKKKMFTGKISFQNKQARSEKNKTTQSDL